MARRRRGLCLNTARALVDTAAETPCENRSRTCRSAARERARVGHARRKPRAALRLLQQKCRTLLVRPNCSPRRPDAVGMYRDTCFQISLQNRSGVVSPSSSSWPSSLTDADDGQSMALTRPSGKEGSLWEPFYQSDGAAGSTHAYHVGDAANGHD